MKHALTATVGLLLTMLPACGVDGGSTAIGEAPDGAAGSDADAATDAALDGSGGDASVKPDVQDASSQDAPEQDVSDDTSGDVSFQYDGAGGDADACAVTVVEALPPPLAMYMILDRSGSMTFANKWETAVVGITQFVQASGAVGAKVALQFFPLDVGHDCAGGAYATPAVAMGALPGNAQAIIDALQATSPEGITTPMEGALNGLSQFCSTYGAVLPGAEEKVVALLVTDGMPDGDCANDPTDLAAIAAAAWTSTPPVPTYVMGMSGADFSVLGKIAEAGGTDAAYSVTTGGSAAFLSVLEEIRADAVGCSYAVPKPDGGTVDIDQIEVTFEPSGGGPQDVPRVADGDACGIGWHFDDNASPSTIELCPSTCNLVKADAQSRVQISLGCLGS